MIPLKWKALKALVLASIILNIGCTKDKDNADDIQNNTIPTFSGYTHRDHLGYQLGTPDLTDWTFDTNWVKAEKELFVENFKSCLKINY